MSIKVKEQYSGVYNARVIQTFYLSSLESVVWEY